MKRVFEIVVETIFWLAIVASPLLLTGAIGLLVYISNERMLWLGIVVCLAGLITGIVLAEKVRRNFGCANYIGKLLS